VGGCAYRDELAVFAAEIADLLASGALRRPVSTEGLEIHFEVGQPRAALVDRGGRIRCRLRKSTPPVFLRRLAPKRLQLTYETGKLNLIGLEGPAISITELME
jgi:hypothetical protein